MWFFSSKSEQLQIEFSPWDAERWGRHVLRCWEENISLSACADLGRCRPVGRGREDRALLGGALSYTDRAGCAGACRQDGVLEVSRHTHGSTHGVHVQAQLLPAGEKWHPRRKVLGSPGAPKKGFLQGRGSAGAGRRWCAFLPLKKVLLFIFLLPLPCGCKPALWKQTSSTSDWQLSAWILSQYKPQVLHSRRKIMPLIQQRDLDALATPKRGLALHILSIRDSRWKSSTRRGLTSTSLLSLFLLGKL